MSKAREKLKQLNKDLIDIKNTMLNNIKEIDTPIQIYTHLDADGLSSGAILGKALFRENIPFQIIVLRQLEKTEIKKISKTFQESNSIYIFTDFGSGQYLEIEKELKSDGNHNLVIILDHHLPQTVSKKEDINLIEKIYRETKSWQINPYFFGIDGSIEVSSAGLCYYLAKCLNNNNLDLSSIAITGAIGDIQNQGPNKSFLGLNTLILEDAKDSGVVEVVDDLNFSSIKPLNEAIAYSTEIILPGLTKDVNKTLIFLQSLGILMEDSKGNIRTLNDLNKDEKKKVTTAIIEYASIKLDIKPSKIIDRLIIKRYLLKNEEFNSEIRDIADFSNLLNACGRTYNASLGIAIAMGDRKDVFQKSKEVLKQYKYSLLNSLNWLLENQKIEQKENIQFYFGEDIIPENIIGTITSMLVFENIRGMDNTKPIFGIAKRVDENVYKISARAHEKIVKQGINLSDAIREACELSNLDVLGGGHPPAAGTKVPVDKIEIFLENCNLVIGKQLKK